MKMNNKLQAWFLRAAGVLLVGGVGFACTAEVGFFGERLASEVCREGVPGCFGEGEKGECVVGDGSCELGYVCRGAEGALPGSPGECQPECRVGSNQGCPQGQVCMGPENAQYREPGRCRPFQPDAPTCKLNDNSCEAGYSCILKSPGSTEGTCQDVAECRVGGGGCPQWQNCVGTHGNAQGVPGTCEGEPSCRVGDGSCPPWQNCVGYESNVLNAAGRCQGEPQCRVDDNRCPASTRCVGYENNTTGSPGRCQEVTVQPRDINQLYIFFGHNSVGGEIVNGLSNTTTGLRILSYTPASITSNGANHFGTQGNRRPGFLTVTTYDMYGSETATRNQIAAFAAHVRLLMNGVTNSRGEVTVPGQRLDIAFVKFCFMAFDNPVTDINTDAKVDSFFNEYVRQMDALQTQFPELILVHFTQTSRPCAYTDHAIHQGNLRRMRFSQHIRNHYGHTGRVFDLARIQSSTADGPVVHCSCDNAPAGNSRQYCLNENVYPSNQVTALLQSYVPGAATNTDGHLNTVGRNHIARELANFLSTVR